MTKDLVKKHFWHYYSKRAKTIALLRMITAPIRKIKDIIVDKATLLIKYKL